MNLKPIVILLLLFSESNVSSQSVYVADWISTPNVGAQGVTVDMNSGTIYVSLQSWNVVTRYTSAGVDTSPLSCPSYPINLYSCPPFAASSWPYAISYHPKTGIIYAALQGTGGNAIGTVPVGGGGVSVLAAGISGPFGIVVGPVSGSVYYTESGANRIVLYPNHPFSAVFSNPKHIACDSFENLYVTDIHRVWRISNSTTAIAMIVAGSTTAGNADGFSTAAQFNTPYGIAVDIDLNMYVAANNAIRKVDSARMVSTIAGLSGTSGATNGHGTIARFGSVNSLAVDSQGHVLAADSSNSKVRKIFLCKPGSFYDTVSSSCVYSFCAVGYGYVSGKCQLCDVGFFKGNTSLVPCSPCSAGYESSGDRSSCVACNPGYYRNSSMTQCVSCPVSFVTSSTATSLCTMCPLGTEANTNQTLCVSCQSGKYRDGTMSSCASCPTGLLPSSDNSTCICSQGKVNLSAGTNVPTCVSCPLFASCNATSILSCQAPYKINSIRDSCEQCPFNQ